MPAAMAPKPSNPNEQAIFCVGLRIKRSVILALIPSVPASPVKSPVMSGPYQRKNGLPFAIALEPVCRISPFASTISNDSIESADMP